MYNKQKFSKLNDKKVLHKVKKRWVVMSMALLGMLGVGAASHAQAHADTQTTDPNAHTNTQTKQGTAKNAYTLTNQNDRANNAKQSANQIMSQAHRLTSNLVRNQMVTQSGNQTNNGRQQPNATQPQIQNQGSKVQQPKPVNGNAADQKLNQNGVKLGTNRQNQPNQVQNRLNSPLVKLGASQQQPIQTGTWGTANVAVDPNTDTMTVSNGQVEGMSSGNDGGFSFGENYTLPNNKTDWKLIFKNVTGTDSNRGCLLDMDTSGISGGYPNNYWLKQFSDIDFSQSNFGSTFDGGGLIYSADDESTPYSNLKHVHMGNNSTTLSSYAYAPNLLEFDATHSFGFGGLDVGNPLLKSDGTIIQNTQQTLASGEYYGTQNDPVTFHKESDSNPDSIVNGSNNPTVLEPKVPDANYHGNNLADQASNIPSDDMPSNYYVDAFNPLDNYDRSAQKVTLNAIPDHIWTGYQWGKDNVTIDTNAKTVTVDGGQPVSGNFFNNVKKVTKTNNPNDPNSNSVGNTLSSLPNGTGWKIIIKNATAPSDSTSLFDGSVNSGLSNAFSEIDASGLNVKNTSKADRMLASDTNLSEVTFSNSDQFPNGFSDTDMFKNDHALASLSTGGTNFVNNDADGLNGDSPSGWQITGTDQVAQKNDGMSAGQDWLSTNNQYTYNYSDEFKSDGGSVHRTHLNSDVHFGLPEENGQLTSYANSHNWVVDGNPSAPQLTKNNTTISDGHGHTFTGNKYTITVPVAEKGDWNKFEYSDDNTGSDAGHGSDTNDDENTIKTDALNTDVPSGYSPIVNMLPTPERSNRGVYQKGNQTYYGIVSAYHIPVLKKQAGVTFNYIDVNGNHQIYTTTIKKPQSDVQKFMDSDIDKAPDSTWYHNPQVGNSIGGNNNNKDGEISSSTTSNPVRYTTSNGTYYGQLTTYNVSVLPKTDKAFEYEYTTNDGSTGNAGSDTSFTQYDSDNTLPQYPKGIKSGYYYHGGEISSLGTTSDSPYTVNGKTWYGSRKQVKAVVDKIANKSDSIYNFYVQGQPNDVVQSIMEPGQPHTKSDISGVYQHDLTNTTYYKAPSTVKAPADYDPQSTPNYVYSYNGNLYKGTQYTYNLPVVSVTDGNQNGTNGKPNVPVNGDMVVGKINIPVYDGPSNDNLKGYMGLQFDSPLEENGGTDGTAIADSNNPLHIGSDYHLNLNNAGDNSYWIKNYARNLFFNNDSNYNEGSEQAGAGNGFQGIKNPSDVWIRFQNVGTTIPHDQNEKDNRIDMWMSFNKDGSNAHDVATVTGKTTTDPSRPNAKFNDDRDFVINGIKWNSSNNQSNHYDQVSTNGSNPISLHFNLQNEQKNSYIYYTNFDHDLIDANSHRASIQYNNTPDQQNDFTFNGAPIFEYHSSGNQVATTNENVGTYNSSNHTLTYNGNSNQVSDIYPSNNQFKIDGITYKVNGSGSNNVSVTSDQPIGTYDKTSGKLKFSDGSTLGTNGEYSDPTTKTTGKYGGVVTWQNTSDNHYAGQAVAAKDASNYASDFEPYAQLTNNVYHGNDDDGYVQTTVPKQLTNNGFEPEPPSINYSDIGFKSYQKDNNGNAILHVDGMPNKTQNADNASHFNASDSVNGMSSDDLANGSIPFVSDNRLNGAKKFNVPNVGNNAISKNPIHTGDSALVTPFANQVGQISENSKPGMHWIAPNSQVIQSDYIPSADDETEHGTFDVNGRFVPDDYEAYHDAADPKNKNLVWEKSQPKLHFMEYNPDTNQTIDPGIVMNYKPSIANDDYVGKDEFYTNNDFMRDMSSNGALNTLKGTNNGGRTLAQDGYTFLDPNANGANTLMENGSLQQCFVLPKGNGDFDIYVAKSTPNSNPNDHDAYDRYYPVGPYNPNFNNSQPVSPNNLPYIPDNSRPIPAAQPDTDTNPDVNPYNNIIPSPNHAHMDPNDPADHGNEVPNGKGWVPAANMPAVQADFTISADVSPNDGGNEIDASGIPVSVDIDLAHSSLNTPYTLSTQNIRAAIINYALKQGYTDKDGESEDLYYDSIMRKPGALYKSIRYELKTDGHGNYHIVLADPNGNTNAGQFMFTPSNVIINYEGAVYKRNAKNQMIAYDKNGNPLDGTQKDQFNRLSDGHDGDNVESVVAEGYQGMRIDPNHNRDVQSFFHAQGWTLHPVSGEVFKPLILSGIDSKYLNHKETNSKDGSYNPTTQGDVNAGLVKRNWQMHDFFSSDSNNGDFREDKQLSDEKLVNHVGTPSNGESSDGTIVINGITLDYSKNNKQVSYKNAQGNEIPLGTYSGDNGGTLTYKNGTKLVTTAAGKTASDSDGQVLMANPATGNLEINPLYPVIHSNPAPVSPSSPSVSSPRLGSVQRVRVRVTRNQRTAHDDYTPEEVKNYHDGFNVRVLHQAALQASVQHGVQKAQRFLKPNAQLHALGLVVTKHGNYFVVINGHRIAYLRADKNLVKILGL